MNKLVLKNDVWCSQNASALSYPGDGNSTCYQVEDRSFWFLNRNAQILDFVMGSLNGKSPSEFKILDVGGGNGFVSLALQKAGFETYLLEPGEGAFNAKKRGIQNVYKCTLEELPEEFKFDFIGFFDVLEHLELPGDALRLASSKLKNSGKIVVTVPAYQALFSSDDVSAGHYRRYSLGALKALVRSSGLSVQRASYFFLALLLPIALFRTVPYRLGLSQKSQSAPSDAQRDHVPPRLVLMVVNSVFAVERFLIRSFRRLPLGASVILVATKK